MKFAQEKNAAIVVIMITTTSQQVDFFTDYIYQKMALLVWHIRFTGKEKEGFFYCIYYHRLVF